MATTLICMSVIDTNISPPFCGSGWVSVDTGLGFDIAQLDPASLGGAFLAGALVCFSAYAIAWAGGFVISILR